MRDFSLQKQFNVFILSKKSVGLLTFNIGIGHFLRCNRCIADIIQLLWYNNCTIEKNRVILYVVTYIC